ncbi:MAG TPA: hypothetical protein VJ783_29995 [Pirellulales bacterium]|nr:hypothetical protein [Pirellulales bacterium]
MSSKLGFYGWVRENVKRAVLLGFSDAVEQLGAPLDAEDVSPQLLAVLRQPKALLPTETTAAKPAGAGRKRLGQTLDQIQQRSAAGTSTASGAGQ